ncbi:hypothetical protein B0181_11025, partial [Moraxella caviae]
MTQRHAQNSKHKLTLKNISHCFGAVAVLDDVSLEVRTGSVVAIVGASGSGKTTLFHIAAGLIAPDAGVVSIDGQDVTGKAGQVGYMLQKDLLLPFYRVYDNIALPLILQNLPKDEIAQRIMPKLDDFGLSEHIQKYPHELSGGQRQRAALLRTYLANDEIMLLDEPFSALDYITKRAMHAWFAAFQQRTGLTCLMITHDIDEAMALADCVYVLKGKVHDKAQNESEKHGATLSQPFIVPKSENFRLFSKP